MFRSVLTKIYLTVPALFHATRFLSPAYYHAKKSARAYRSQYLAATDAYQRNRHSTKQLVAVEAVGAHILWPHAADTPIALPPNYPRLVKRVSTSVAELFELAENCFFLPRISAPPPGTSTAAVPEVVRGDVITVQLKNYNAVDGLEALCDALLPAVEQHVYQSHVMVDKVYVYRSLRSRHTEQISWLWHYDNHPAQILKIMVYLTDVDDSDGPFEYLVSNATGIPLKLQPLPNLGRPFIETRVSPPRLQRYVRRGYRPFKLTGAAGTTVLFSDNIIHKANIPTRNHRDVVVFQLRPALSVSQRAINPAWTGSFQHVDIPPDPYSIHSLPKPKMASG